MQPPVTIGNGDRNHLIDHGPQMVGLIVFTLALWAQVGDAYVGRFIGDGLNLVVAKALARGDGLSLIHLPGSVQAPWVPPLYPGLVSLIGRVWPAFPENMVLVQILDSALLGCAAWTVSLQVRKLDVSPWISYVTVAFAFLSTSILSLAVSAFAEPLFLVLTASAVLLADREEVSHGAAVTAGTLAGAAALTGHLGIFVILGIGSAYAVRQKPIHAATTVLAGIIVVLPWFVWSARVADPTGLAAGANALAQQAADMRGGVSWQGVGPLVNLLLPSGPRAIVFVTGPIAAAFFGIGLITTFVRAPAFVIVVAFCMLGAWLHPLAVARNEWILFPWFMTLLVIGFWRSWGYVRQTRIPVTVAFVALAMLYVPRTVMAVASRDFAAGVAAENEHLGLLVQSINAELPEDAILASDAPAMMHLYTGRTVLPAMPVPTSETTADVERWYCRWGVTHLVRTDLSVPGRVGDDLLRDLGSSVSPVFELTGGPSLYRFACRG